MIKGHRNSANFPASSVPSESFIPNNSAALIVAARIACAGVAPIAGTGLTVAPERNDRSVAIVDHRPNLDRPMTDRRVSAVDSSRSTGRGTP